MEPRIETDTSGNKRHYNNQNKLHREDGPAVQFANGTKLWWINGELHREDGPAAIWPNGSTWWFINGVCLSEEEFRHRTNRNCKLPDYLK